MPPVLNLPLPGAAPGQTSPTSTPTPVKPFGQPVGIIPGDLPEGRFDFIPEDGRAVALTIDDGADASVLRAYCDLASRTGLRLTFFVTGSFTGWTDSVDALRPLVDDGQIFLGNHSWSHPDFVRCGNSEIVSELRRNERFLINTFGVTGRPFCRPPFGSSNARVRSVLAEHGYPSVAMWSGTFADSTSVTQPFILAQAQQFLAPGRMVLGHADFPNVIGVLDNIAALIEARGLQPVHLRDLYETRGVELATYSVSPEPTLTPTPSPSASATPSKSPSKTPSRSTSTSPTRTPSKTSTRTPTPTPIYPGYLDPATPGG